MREYFAREPRWSNWQLLAGAALVAVVVGGYLAWGLVRPDERSTTEIEQQIADWAESELGGGPVEVQCPDPIEWRVGETFNCIATQADATVGVAVTMENEDGAVTWRAG